MPTRNSGAFGGGAKSSAPEGRWVTFTSMIIGTARDNRIALLMSGCRARVLPIVDAGFARDSQKALLFLCALARHSFGSGVRSLLLNFDRPLKSRTPR